MAPAFEQAGGIIETAVSKCIQLDEVGPQPVDDQFLAFGVEHFLAIGFAHVKLSMAAPFSVEILAIEMSRFRSFNAREMS